MSRYFNLRYRLFSLRFYIYNRRLITISLGVSKLKVVTEINSLVDLVRRVGLVSHLLRQFEARTHL